MWRSTLGALKYLYSGDAVEETTGHLDMRMFFPQELDALVRYNGFTILNKWGDLQRTAFGPDSPLQVLECGPDSPEQQP